jgi:hypothetical protein
MILILTRVWLCIDVPSNYSGRNLFGLEILASTKHKILLVQYAVRLGLKEYWKIFEKKNFTRLNQESDI